MRYLQKPFLPLVAVAAAGLAIVAAPGHAIAQEIKVEAAKPGGVYAAGEKIVWRLKVSGEGAAGVQKIAYTLKKGMLTDAGKGELTVTDGAAELETKLDEPGTLYAEFSAAVPGKENIKAAAGALVAPDRIPPSAPPPPDFDAFWKAKLAELRTVPVNPKLEPGESGKPEVDYWKVTLDNIRGSKVRGQLARPKAPGKRPALLVVQWAGVYPLQKGWATDRAREGWLTLNINAHDLPIDEPEEFYKSNKELQNYAAIGNDDRDTSYFLRMYLSCYRAADYLTSRDDWDGKTLVVMGTSQGGLQAIMTGGFHPKVTALLANVPAGCDLTGPAFGRQGGWPMWWWQTQGKDSAKVREAARYYDVVNFARNIRCPALISVGLLDLTCPPPGVVVAYNQVRGPKELVVLEWSDHQGRNNTQAPYYARSAEWLGKLVKGEPAPVKAAQ